MRIFRLSYCGHIVCSLALIVTIAGCGSNNSSSPIIDNTPPVNTTGKIFIEPSAKMATYRSPADLSTSVNFINTGALSTPDEYVKLTLSASDNVAVTAYYILEDSNPTPAAPLATAPDCVSPNNAGCWVPVVAINSYLAFVPFTLSAGSGQKTVHVWFKDASNNVSAQAADTILLAGTAFFAEIAFGADYGLGLDSDGQVWTWGANWQTQTSIPTYGAPITLPRKVKKYDGSDFNNVAHITAGYYHSLAIMRGTSEVWGWGAGAQALGRGGFYPAWYEPEPVVTPSGSGRLSNAVLIAAGNASSYAVLATGEVYSWGANFNGQGGTGGTGNSYTPLRVLGIDGVGFLSGVASISAGGAHVIVKMNDGSAASWGLNNDGQLCLGTPPATEDKTGRAVPTAIPSVGTNVAAVNTGGTQVSDVSTLILMNDTTVMACGRNDYAQFGIGTISGVGTSIPVQTKNATGTGPLTGIIKIAASGAHSVALSNDNKVWIWGGTLGSCTGSWSDKYLPVRVKELTGADCSSAVDMTGVVDIETTWGSSNIIFRKSDNSAWALGWNSSYQVGDGTTINRDYAVRILAKKRYMEADAGAFHNLVISGINAVFSAGWNEFGQLGLNLLDRYGSFVRNVVSSSNVALANIIHIGAGYTHSLAVKNDGTVWSWGDNYHGQLGDGASVSWRNYYVQVVGVGGAGFLTNITNVAAGGYHSLALDSSGNVWAWGRNDEGQLGNTSVTGNTNTPVQVTGLTNIVAIAAGNDHSLAVKNDGTVWAWGWNEYGQLGTGDNTYRPTPVQVTGLTNVYAVAASAGSFHSTAIRNDGTVWSWGRNNYGQLGDGTTTDRNIPVQLATISRILAVAAGGYHTVALKDNGDGTVGVWAWGKNNWGQLGNLLQTDSSIPVQVVAGVSGVGFLSGIIDVSAGVEHSMALTNDYGKVFAWGSDFNRQLGIGQLDPLPPENWYGSPIISMPLNN